MAALRKNSVVAARVDEASVTSALTLAHATSRAAPSPALQLQASLEAAFADEPYVQKWSPRTRLAVIAALATGPWVLIAAAAVALTR